MAVKSKSVYEIVTDKLITAMEQGIIPWKKPWTTIAHQNFITKKPYQGINILLLGIQGYACPYWATYKQIQDLGGSVKQGEHGTPVVFWKIISSIKGKEEQDSSESPTDEKQETRFILRYYTVFNLEQTTLEIPALPEANAVEIPSCEEFIAQHAGNFASIRHSDSVGAYYSPSQDYVNVPAKELFVDSNSYYSTIFHEITHSTGHSSRLNRFKDDGSNTSFGSESYSKEELIAEIGASFLCNHNGIENKTTDNNTVAYLQNWLAALKNDKRLIVFAAAQAEKAAEYIINGSKK